MELLRRLSGFSQSVRGLLCASVVALLVGTILQLVFPFFVGMLVDGTLAGHSNLLREGLPAWASSIDRIGLVLLAIAMAALVCVYLDTLGFMTAGERVLREMRVRVFECVIRLPMTFFSNHRGGEISSQLQGDLTMLQEFLINDSRMLLRYGALALGGFVLMIVTSPLLALTLGLLMPPVIAVAVRFGKSIADVSSRAQERLSASSVILDECLQAITSIKAFTNEDRASEQFRKAQDGYHAIALAGARKRALFTAVILCGVFCSTVFIMWFGSRQIEQANLTPGEFTRFMFFLAFTGSSIGTLAEVFGRLKRAEGGIARLHELLSEQPEVGSGMSGSEKSHVLQGAVCFEGVGFAYPARNDVAVLKDVCLDVEPGEVVALIGPSGAGKTTLVSLLLRFFDPDVGVLSFDGVPAPEIGLRCLRSQVAYVPQEVVLTGASMLENIRYGRFDATEEEVVESARKAHLHDFIEGLPDGYGTLLGDRGAQLSGGQRQRVAIARAILSQSRVLILDEATSALDTESEELVHASMRTLFAQRTSFLIAHRLSSVRLANRIVVMVDGAIAAEGTHEEMIRASDVYRDMWEKQSKSD